MANWLSMGGVAATLLLMGLVPAHAQSDVVNVYTYREPGLIQPLLDKFTEETGIRTNVLFAADGLIERVAAEGELSPADVVITVDTSVAHLAGALGKPVWVLLQQPSEWRWLERGASSPWYPGATLYRQSEPDDWDKVIGAVSADLEQLSANPAPRG